MHFINDLAALSSLSSAFNSMAANILEDYVKPVFKGLSERASGFVMRGTVLFMGILSVALVYIVQNMGSVLQLSMSVAPSCYGPLFGIFAIGIFLPWIGKKATLYGALISAAVIVYVVVRSQLDIASGLIKFETKVTSVEGCIHNFTGLQSQVQPTNVPELERSFHHISYLYYLPFGAIMTCLLASILSLFFGFEDPQMVDPRLLAPFIRKYFERKIIENVESKDIETRF